MVATIKRSRVGVDIIVSFLSHEWRMHRIMQNVGFYPYSVFMDHTEIIVRALEGSASTLSF